MTSPYRLALLTDPPTWCGMALSGRSLDLLTALAGSRDARMSDGALIEDNPLPQLAQPAMQEGVWAAEQILELEAGRRTRSFSYRDKGTMATIGRNAAVVQMARLHGLRIDVTGFVAWLAWVGLHLYFLLGGRNRLQSMINLAARYLTFSRQASGIIGDIVDEGGDPGGAGPAAEG